MSDSLLLAASLTDPALIPAAEAAGLDLVVLEQAPLDPLLVGARAAALTASIGIVVAAPTTTTEPFHVSTAVATIDFVSRGRAGWLAETVDRADADALVTWDVPEDVLGDAREYVDVVRGLWTTWDADAEIRDRSTDRFFDRDRVHHLAYKGKYLDIRGPSITPRPPQGRPPVVVRDPALADVADVLLVRDPADATPAPVRLLEVDHGEGSHDADGFDGLLLHHVTEAGLAALARTPPRDGETLRARLGLEEVARA
ncbi:LLM class flavin-dependent oxidoreductase [Conexibacter woesei]|uniref:LLM class flavin-dependent oxidoreductase n=1 Tax=Conexibacter woesei TaxID=191495 RepID=UPI00041CD89A|nr:LLM class flavin-dependent oxidoreductase [Conexibacter woesei]